MDYRDPEIAEIYDLINPRAQDTDFYLSLAGQQPCTVLDLGCGTGTLCCALAERGHQVTGVDPAAAMLAVAKRKPFAGQVEWVESSAQDYRSQKRFELIVMTGHALQCLPTDVDALDTFKTMRRHLENRGRIVFESRNPQVDWAGIWGKRKPVVHKCSSGELIETLENIVKDDEFVSFQTSYRFKGRVLTTNSRLRFPCREHIQELLLGSQLAVRNLFGDWAGGGFDPANSSEMIFVAETASADI